MAVIKRRSPDVWVALLLNCLLLATSFVDGRSHNNLRHDSNSNHQDHRELQRLAAGVINALISVVTPTISRAVQNQVKLHYDQADFYTEASPIEDKWIYLLRGRMKRPRQIAKDEWPK